MSLIYKIIDNCPQCNAENAYGNVNVHNNVLTQECSKCEYIKLISLPILDKKIIYLDQSFFSHAFRKCEKDYIRKSNLIIELISQQLLVCPYSDIHEIETNLWRDEKRKNDLLSFIRQIARGHNFLASYEVKMKQLVKSFLAFTKCDSSDYLFERSDILDNDINEWDDYSWINIPYNYYNEGELEEVRQRKNESVLRFIREFDKWRKHEGIFDEDYQVEIRAKAQEFYSAFIQLIQKGINGNSYPSKNAEFLWHLFLINQDKLSDPQKVVDRLLTFLQSEYFANVPFVKIAAYLCSMLKKKTKENPNWLKNEAVAKKQLTGIYFDIEHISVYAPYCDAIFTDKMMYEWISQFMEDSYCNNNYQFKIFSASRWDGFQESYARILCTESKLTN